MCRSFIILLLLCFTGPVNGSNRVNLIHYSRFVSAWSTSFGEPAFNESFDFDNNNYIDAADLGYLAENWLAQTDDFYLPPQTARKKLSFNTGWKFYRGDVPADAPKSTSYDDSSWQQVSIPHNPPMNPPDPDPLRPDWPDYSYERVSWYRKHFNLDPNYKGGKIFIEFEAVNTIADVWVNDTHLTTHYGGYLPFTVDITGCVNFGPAENVIAVKADNTDNPDVPIGNDSWFNWGGIYRDVWLHVTDSLHITDAVYADIVAGGGIFVTYPSVTASQAQVQVKTHIENEYPADKSCTVKTYIVDADNSPVASMTAAQTIPAGDDYTFIQSVEVNDPCLWHPEHPYLYTLCSEVYADGNPVDTYLTKIGIRSISFSKTDGFKINGQTFRFRGTNRLQDYPYIGYAVGNLAQRRDAEKLKEAGFDYIRTAHYPQDPAFMDACDELGIMILDEIPGCHHFGGTEFINHSYQNMRDMIRRDRNHACVIAWELSINETWWEDANYTPNAVAIGHEEYPGDQCYVAGWKDGGMWGEPALYDIMIATPTAGARTYPGPLPLIISEYGHWEYGGHSSTSDVHRMDGQAAMLQQAWNHQEGHHLNRGLANMCGDGLWVGIDYGPYPQGVLDTFRLPKFSYYFFRSQRDPDINIPGIDTGPMVFIANYWTSASPADVKVYSNCEQVKLYINDTLQDTRYPDTDYPTANLLHPPFTFSSLTWQAGEIKAEGLIDGQVAATHIVHTPGQAEALLVEFDVTDLPANGSETILVYASIIDSSGTLVHDASNKVTFDVTGAASLLSPETVDAEAGIATALIKVSDRPGPINVTASAPGLTAGYASVTTR